MYVSAFAKFYSKLILTQITIYDNTFRNRHTNYLKTSPNAHYLQDNRVFSLSTTSPRNRNYSKHNAKPHITAAGRDKA